MMQWLESKRGNGDCAGEVVLHERIVDSLLGADPC
jgi:hypothetical protein